MILTALRQERPQLRLAKEVRPLSEAGGGSICPGTDTSPTTFPRRSSQTGLSTHRSPTHTGLSTDDPIAAEAIRLAPRAFEATRLGGLASRKDGWHGVRLAVMTNLVRAKFEQHPDLAKKLMATGDARIRGAFSMSGSYWQGGAQGRNWLGRILELVRSELRLRKVVSGGST